MTEIVHDNPARTPQGVARDTNPVIDCGSIKNYKKNVKIHSQRTAL
jgi:hypothetical protein